MIDPTEREKCLKEVQLLQSVSHPHIIQYLDSFIANNELFIVVEWAEKGDLKAVIKRAIQVRLMKTLIV
jgi:serine/threonine protein kinase